MIVYYFRENMSFVVALKFSDAHFRPLHIQPYPFHLNTQWLAEFKCPLSKKEVTPREACDDPNFYDNGLHLKKSHKYKYYYHQVQLQLFVGIDKYDWCDYCVYTPNGRSLCGSVTRASGKVPSHPMVGWTMKPHFLVDNPFFP